MNQRLPIATENRNSLKGMAAGHPASNPSFSATFCLKTLENQGFYLFFESKNGNAFEEKLKNSLHTCN
jgi:hypothetical protein